MKIITCLWFGLFLWACHSGDTVVSLQLKNAEGKKVFVLVPRGNLILGVTDTIVSVKEDSVYRFPVRLKGIAPMLFRVDGGRMINLLLEPGHPLSVVYDLKDQSCRIEGKNAEGVMVYNQLAQDKNEYKYEWIKDYTRAPLDTVPEKVDSHFRALEAREIAVFDSLRQQGQISQALNEFIRKDIHLYYSLTLSKIARGMSELVNKEAYRQYWEQLYRENPFREDEVYSQWFYGFADLYLRFYLPRHLSEDMTVPRLNNVKQMYEFYYNLYDQHLSNPVVREVLHAELLFSWALNNKTFSLEIIPYFEKFSQQFPGSVYNSVFEPYMWQLKVFEEKIKQDFSPEIRFVEGYSELKTLDELLAQFKGKPVFVDFWFSTCGPCKEEFSYAKSLKAFLKEQQIEMLYVSVDTDNMDENWKNNIKYFDLAGWHVRTSRELHTNLGEQYKIYSFPAYMLVDKEGKIVLPDAECPSEKEKLYEQIREAIPL